MKKLVMASLVICFAIGPARAQVSIDFGQITCEQFRLYTVMNPKEIAIWLSGYFRGKRGGGTVVNVQESKDNIFKLEQACASKANYKLPIMQVVEKLLAGKAE
jgi:hypothetical protein